MNKVKVMFDGGWIRPRLARASRGPRGLQPPPGYLAEALTSRDLVEPGIYSMTDFLVPTLVDFAPPDLAAEMVPRLLRGPETWCQGFSEPGTGSNLASLTCRATQTDTGWRVSGQKVWTLAWPSMPSAAFY